MEKTAAVETVLIVMETDMTAVKKKLRATVVRTKILLRIRMEQVADHIQAILIAVQVLTLKIVGMTEAAMKMEVETLNRVQTSLIRTEIKITKTKNIQRRLHSKANYQRKQPIF